jgi:hypothetical protein
MHRCTIVHLGVGAGVAICVGEDVGIDIGLV